MDGPIAVLMLLLVVTGILLKSKFGGAGLSRVWTLGIGDLAFGYLCLVDVRHVDYVDPCPHVDRYAIAACLPGRLEAKLLWRMLRCDGLAEKGTFLIRCVTSVAHHGFLSSTCIA